MRHRWMVFMPFEVTDQDAARVATGEGLDPAVAALPDSQLAADERPAPGDARPFFGLHNVVRDLVSVGCYVCEQPYTTEVAAAPCPGDPSGKSVDELHLPDSRLGAPVAGFSGVGRNDPCPCGSGLKFKRCHGSG